VSLAGAWPIYAGIMLATGIGIPIMAAANATLGARLESAPVAAAILFAVAFATTALAAIVTGPPGKSLFAAAPWPYYVSGLLVAFYVLSITAIAPRFGVGNAIFFVLLGQIASAAAIDQFGLFGAAKSEIGIARLCGIVLMAAGVFLARKPMGG
jgi:transporter family-2 protein